MTRNKDRKVPLKVGITGSIGMGKTTVALEMAKFDLPLWEADNVVHKLYKKKNMGYDIVKEIAPAAATGPSVNRAILSDMLIQNPILLPILEAKLKPLLEVDRKNFIFQHSEKKIVLFDIPLLFETKAESWLDIVIVVMTSSAVQNKRVMERGSITKEKYQYLKSLQTSISKKIKKADYVIDNNADKKALKQKIKKIMEKIKP